MGNSQGKPVVFNLDLPYEVFFHSSAALWVLVAAHTLYRALARRPYSTPASVLNKIGLFDPPAGYPRARRPHCADPTAPPPLDRPGA